VTRSADDLLRQVRDTAEGFDVFGELGRRSDADIWYLSRDRASGALVALRLRQEGLDSRGRPEYSLEIANELDKEVPLGEGECPGCRAPLRSFARFCGKCGADLTTLSRMPATKEERTALLEQVREASAEFYDVVGEMPWGGGAGLVYFALERSTGRLVRLRLRVEGSDFSLGETQTMVALKTRVLAAYTSDVGAPAVPPPEPAPPLPAPTGKRISVRLVLVVAGLVALLGILYAVLV